uniref:Diacylglycerol acyltransferase 3 n=1 Tax=Camelina sativa TaxID=90675 RepID=A0A1Q1NA43_CAMSA|nr:diacylglycerol acyltransferase 3 [Camelina sativa]
MEKEKKALKKKAKILKSLSKNLDMFSCIGFGLDPEAGLVGEVQTKTISEATEILVKQLEQLKAEEKLLKKQRKEEKAKAKALKKMTEMDSESSSSSESSDSDCDKGKVVDMSSFRNKAQPILEPLQPEATLVTTLPRIQEDAQSCKDTSEALQIALQTSTVFPSMANPGQTMKKVEAVPVVGLPLKRVEVCMGGKCKKLGGAVLLDEFQKAMTGFQGSAVACKCMGKCRDGPNVRVVNETDAVMTDSVMTPSKTVCLGVGLQDVETIVTSFFDEECSRENSVVSF